jgi:multidrug efflux pump subunit AcrB
MNAIEIFLIVAGIICVIVSVVMNFSDQSDKKEVTVSTDLTDEQKNKIKQQIDTIIDDQVNGLSEKTEAALDKISNTKILEMNEYAESVLGEINRNHNETVFLYDMLNEKAKEIKTTVKDANNTKRQVEKLHAEVKASDDVPADNNTDAVNESKKQEKDSMDTKDIAKERLTALNKKNNEKIKSSEGKRKVNRQVEKLDPDMSSNEKILKLNEMGVSVKEIAKQLNLGIGEVKLVIDLYKGGK